MRSEKFQKQIRKAWDSRGITEARTESGCFPYLTNYELPELRRKGKARKDERISEN